MSDFPRFLGGTLAFAGVLLLATQIVGSVALPQGEATQRLYLLVVLPGGIALGLICSYWLVYRGGLERLGLEE